MSDKEIARPRNSSIAINPESNPEGKGLNGFLLDWHASQPRGVAVKQERQILAEYFTSMLILSAAFKFKPVVGQQYYLYWMDNYWTLSLIAPQEWSERRRAAFAGQCSLHPDMTWTITLSDKLKNQEPVSDAISDFYTAFVDRLTTDDTLESELPEYILELNYYQRLYASAFSRSLRGSLTMGGQRNRKSNAWLQKLPRQAQRLLLDTE